MWNPCFPHRNSHLPRRSPSRGGPPPASHHLQMLCTPIHGAPQGPWGRRFLCPQLMAQRESSTRSFSGQLWFQIFVLVSQFGIWKTYSLQLHYSTEISPTTFHKRRHMTIRPAAVKSEIKFQRPHSVPDGQMLGRQEGQGCSRCDVGCQPASSYINTEFLRNTHCTYLCFTIWSSISPSY